MKVSDIPAEKLEAQHKRGKLHAVERLALLFDDGLMEALIPPAEGDGVYVCAGRVGGKPVIAASQDFNFKGGSLGLKQGRNIVKAIDIAAKRRCPVVFINDSGGARVQEGIDSLAGYGEIFNRQIQLSGVIPQISVIAGPCAGGASYMPALTDFVFAVQGIGNMFLTGPQIIEEITGEKVDKETLGGVAMHASTSGVVHFGMPDEHSCFAEVRRLIAMLPSGRWDTAYSGYSYLKRHSLRTFELPDSTQHKPFPIRDIIDAVIDEHSLVEVHEHFARQIIVGFATIAGIRVGLIANQTAFMAGSLDCDSSDKAARFVRFCDSRGIPLVSLTDVPGFLPGRDQEMKGVIRHGAKLLYAFSEATVPKINVIIRNAYGGAYIAMNSLHLQADVVLAWQNSSIAVMGEKGAVALLHGKEAAKLPESERQAFIDGKLKEYREVTSNCRNALDKGYVEKIIEPRQTRQEIITHLLALKKKRRGKRHGNIPL